MDLHNERDKSCFTNVLLFFLTFIRREIEHDNDLQIRNSQREKVIILMRFIGE